MRYHRHPGRCVTLIPATSRSLPRLAWLLAACLGSTRQAAADQWLLQGNLAQQAQYNDNIAMSSAQKNSVFGYLVTPTLQASQKTGVYDISFQGQGDIRRYDNSQWDCNNYNLSSNDNYRVSSNNVFGLSGGYSSACSYSQQITDSGLLASSIQSTTFRVAPSWAWQWTPRDQVKLTTSYAQTTYNGGAVTAPTAIGAAPLSLGLIGNDTYQATLGGSHQWSRDLTLTGNFNAANTQYIGSNTTAGLNTGSNISSQNLYSFQAGGSYVINRLWSANLNGGPVWVDSQNSGVGGSDTSSLGGIANAGLVYKGEVSNFSALLSNAVSPSAIGQTLQSQSASANYSYKLTRQVSLNMAGNVMHSQSIGGQQLVNPTSQYSRNYYTATSGLAWEFVPKWRLMGSYTYSRQDIQQDNIGSGSGTSNLVMLSLNYAWDGIRQSQ